MRVLPRHSEKFHAALVIAYGFIDLSFEEKGNKVGRAVFVHSVAVSVEDFELIVQSLPALLLGRLAGACCERR